MRHVRILTLLILLVISTLSACYQNNDVDVGALQSELDEVKAQNQQLQTENETLQQTVTTLQTQIDESNKEKTVQSGDVTVILSGKSTSTGSFSQYYVDCVFSVTNNTDKEIKGIQGIAHFKDLFGVEILSSHADFTGIKIGPGETVTIDDLSFDCNQFIDEHMKLYNTAFEDLIFEYDVNTIVFSDGTSKKQ